LKLSEWIKILEELKSKGLRIVHISSLSSLTDINARSLSVTIWRLEKYGLVERVEKGWICIDKCTPIDLVKTLFPSAYLSLEWALHYHDVLDQEIKIVTAVWLSKTKRAKHGKYMFEIHSIKKSLYFGFDTKNMVASPEKALLDTIYFRKNYPSYELNLDILNYKKIKIYSKSYPKRVRKTIRRIFKEM